MSEDISSTPCPCDLVVFVAHPDDAELNCGGTLALAAEQGWRTGVVDFTRGELSTRGDLQTRARETNEASRALNLSCRINLGLPDGHLHDCDEHRRAVVRLLRQMRPRVIVAPPLDDHHADHMAVGEIVSRSFYLSGVEKYVPDLKPWRPYSLLHYLGSRPAIPHIVVDISGVYEKRTRAIACYRSQLHDSDSTERSTRVSHPRFLDWLDGASRHYGFLIGVRYGEAFTSPEPVAAHDLVQQFGRVRWEEPDETT